MRSYRDCPSSITLLFDGSGTAAVGLNFEERIQLPYSSDGAAYGNDSLRCWRRSNLEASSFSHQ